MHKVQTCCAQMANTKLYSGGAIGVKLLGAPTSSLQIEIPITIQLSSPSPRVAERPDATLAPSLENSRMLQIRITNLSSSPCSRIAKFPDAVITIENQSSAPSFKFGKLADAIYYNMKSIIQPYLQGHNIRRYGILNSNRKSMIRPKLEGWRKPKHFT